MEIGNHKLCLRDYKDTSLKKGEDLCREVVHTEAGISIPALGGATFSSGKDSRLQISEEEREDEEWEESSQWSGSTEAGR